MIEGEAVGWPREAKCVGPDHQAPGRGTPANGRMLSALLSVGGLLGMTNLAIPGALRTGVYYRLYGGAMLACLMLGVALALRQRLGKAGTFTLVMVGDGLYVVAALCLRHPLSFAGPLMLLFPTMVAAWFLPGRLLMAQLVAVVVACAVGLGGAYPSGALALAQIGVNSVVLDATAVMVFVLRRRVERLLARTERLAHTDPLTGLANRRHLAEHLAALQAHRQTRGGYVAAVLLDVDRFKAVNDHYGHTVGDQVLKAVTAQVLTAVRPGDFVVRMGGEEILVVALCEAPAHAHLLAERLRSSVGSSRLSRWVDEKITVSAGVAVAPLGPAISSDALWCLIDEADAAMYQAKGEGRDRTVTLTLGTPSSIRAPGSAPSVA